MLVIYGITNYPQRTGLTQPTFVLSHFLWLRKLGWFWLWVSQESQSACCQGCSRLKAWRGLEGPLPSWRSQRGFWLEATVPDHVDLSTGLLKCPHNQSEWERARRKPWCLLSLIINVPNHKSDTTLLLFIANASHNSGPIPGMGNESLLKEKRINLWTF